MAESEDRRNQYCAIRIAPHKVEKRHAAFIRKRSFGRPEFPKRIRTPPTPVVSDWANHTGSGLRPILRGFHAHEEPRRQGGDQVGPLPTRPRPKRFRSARPSIAGPVASRSSPLMGRSSVVGSDIVSTQCPLIGFTSAIARTSRQRVCSRFVQVNSAEAVSERVTPRVFFCEHQRRPAWVPPKPQITAATSHALPDPSDRGHDHERKSVLQGGAERALGPKQESRD